MLLLLLLLLLLPLSNYYSIFKALKQTKTEPEVQTLRKLTDIADYEGLGSNQMKITSHYSGQPRAVTSSYKYAAPKKNEKANPF